MQKRYTIYLSEKGVKAKPDIPTSDDLRAFELVTLEAMFKLAANYQKDASGIFSALDSAEGVANLTDTENLIIDEQDLGFINETIKQTVGKRHPDWLVCKGLFEQIRSPEELKEEKPEEEGE